MNIYIIRHAEPDYARDSLTEKGWREAELLCRRLAKIPDASYYTSPLGRARATASLTMQAVGKEVEVCPWLREFDTGYKTRPDFHPTGHGWDFLPEHWAREPMYYDPENWMHAPAYENSGIDAVYRSVVQQFDLLIAKHGYERLSGRCRRSPVLLRQILRAPRRRHPRRLLGLSKSRGLLY